MVNEGNDITLLSNEVLLTQYIGTNPDVNVPDTYTINGNTYNVVALSYYFGEYTVSSGVIEETIESGIFKENKIIENVILGDNIKLIASASGTYEPTINNADYLFHYCSNLVSATIPNNVTSMVFAFQGCTSVVNAPEIPNTVTNMSSAFHSCTSLVNAPEIPDSVTDMDFTFMGCGKLVTAPVIPSSVTSMGNTFDSCTSLTGTVKINSSNVIDVMEIFFLTTKNITVEVPAGSTTYTTFSNGSLPDNITLTTFNAS